MGVEPDPDFWVAYECLSFAGEDSLEGFDTAPSPSSFYVTRGFCAGAVHLDPRAYRKDG